MQHSNQRWQKSNLLAREVQSTLIARVSPAYKIKDRKIKYAVPQVLLGTMCPAILIELGFLSNPHESQLLGSEHYQQLLAKGICEGILTFIKKPAKRPINMIHF